MRITDTHTRILESRISRRLAAIDANRIALLGAGQFTRALLETLDDPTTFASARIDAILDESPSPAHTEILGLPVRPVDDGASFDAIVIATPMHEPAILRRAACGAFGSTPVVGMHTINDPDELDVDTLLLPETAWFRLDLPGLLEQAGRTCTIASATGLPGYGEIDTTIFWADHADTPTDQLIWSGLNLFEFVRGSAACLLGTTVIDPVADRSTLSALMDETIRIFESAMRCFSSSGAPDSVVVANGLLHHQRAIADAALRCGKSAIAIEASCFPGLCHLEMGAAQTGARVAMGRSIRDRLDGRVLTKAQRARTVAYLRERNPHTERRIDSASQPPPMSPEALRAQLNIPDDDRVLLLLGQVCTDTTLVYDAPLIDNIPALARIAAKVVEQTPGWTLIIKPHPKEATGADPIAGRPYRQGAYERLREDPIINQPNVRLVGPAEHNVYTLMRMADAGLAINSQSALEMTAMFARPVCIVGRSAFTGAGFTWDVAHQSALIPTLSALLNDPRLTTDQHDRALQYVDHAVFENLIPAEVRTPAQALARDNEAVHALFAVGCGAINGAVIESKPSSAVSAS